ncbi:hypothetical protein Zm00014a_021979 [Zea mays]|uniref:ER lumen protein retaining receptor family protein n=2 Tax=Zea mays TaxID=4577 RepID=A0A3L6F0P8_MAIZE|nr:ER lumen protein retaining receptor family protein [Zea mays]PWZ26844.1 hypothetical protein Zm00014a_021979 [Zea mays]
MRGSSRRPVAVVMAWVRRQPPKVKAFLAVVAGMAALVFIRFIVHDHDNLFVAAEAAHALGIAVLIYKLTKEKTCAVEGVLFLMPKCFIYAKSRINRGLSLKSQDLTALFLAVRLYCSFVMEYDIHTILDTAALAATLFVIYMIRFKLRSTYMLDKDNFALYYVIVEPFTAHYVFALGVARCDFFVIDIIGCVCVHCKMCWDVLYFVLPHPVLYVSPVYGCLLGDLCLVVFMHGSMEMEEISSLPVLDTRGRLLTALGYGLWPSMVLLSEIVQTFILADFCYYYVKSVFGGQLVLRLPSGVV